MFSSTTTNSPAATGTNSTTSSTATNPPASSRVRISRGTIAGATAGTAIVVITAIIFLLVVRHRRHREAVQLSAVQDRLTLPPPRAPPGSFEIAAIQTKDKVQIPVQTISRPEIEPQERHSDSEGHDMEQVNSHVSVTSFGRTTLMGDPGPNDIAEDHTRAIARVHALERVVLSLRARLGMASRSETPPPSYASESG
jgi:hypothetical protein